MRGKVKLLVYKQNKVCYIDNKMNNMNEMKQFAKLQRLINIFQQISQISWAVNQTRNRYPNPEAMTLEEINQLIKVYIALGIGLEEITNEWRKEYIDYKKQELSNKYDK